jgi:hypothetical protein
MFGLMGNGSGGVMVTVIARVTGLLPTEGITNILAVTGSTKEAGGIGFRGIGINRGFHNQRRSATKHRALRKKFCILCVFVGK